MAHKTHRRQVAARAASRRALIASLLAGQHLADHECRFSPMSADEADRVARAVERGLDLWCWAQGRVQFLSTHQIEVAAKFGLHGWIERTVNGADSADPFFTLRGGWAAIQSHYPEALAVHTRCAGGRDGHSGWTYGPVYLTVAAAKAAGHTHQEKCGCGHTDRPL